MIPDSYVGKKLEVLMYAADEPQDVQPEYHVMAPFRGILTVNEADELQDYVKKSREEWERDI